MCQKDYVIEEDEREACMPATAAYCREAEGFVVCHPTLAVCQREAKELADRLGTPLTCTKR
jgi:hypothetical protein